MRDKFRVLYDDFYFGFERVFSYHRTHLQTWKKYLGVKFDKGLDEVYKNDIRPYWSKYGVNVSRTMVKELYDLTDGHIDHRFVPTDIWERYVVPHFNDLFFARSLADKNLNNLMAPGIKRPQTLFKAMSGSFCLDDFTPISREEAMALCATPGRWVVKPAVDSFGGQDVRFFDGSGDPKAFQDLLAVYRNTDFIVQRAVVQHPDMAALNSSSVNTLRIVTFVFRGQARILSHIIRVGTPGSLVDNIGAGGRQFNVRPDGTVDFSKSNLRATPPGCVDYAGEPRFQGFAVPGFERACQTVLATALKLPHLHIIGWDLAIDEAGDPVMLEFNARGPGQNQSTSGPTFGDSTDEVLAEVFGAPS